MVAGGVNRAGQAVAGAIRQPHRIIEIAAAIQAGHWAEQFVLRHFVTRLGAFEHGRRHVVTGCKCRDGAAAGEQRGPARHRAGNLRDETIEAGARDHRSAFIVWTRTDAYASHTIKQRFTECVVNRIKHDQPATRRASLPCVDERRRNGQIRRQLQVRIVADHERVLAAELKAHLGEHRALTDHLLDQLAGCRRAREADDADAVVLDQRRARIRT